MVGPSVAVARARALASVTEDAAIDPPPLAGLQATVIPATPLPSESFTLTTKGAASGAPDAPVCPSPDTRASVAAGPATAEAVKVTGDPASPEALAVKMSAFAPAPGPRV